MSNSLVVNSESSASSVAGSRLSALLIGVLLFHAVLLISPIVYLAGFRGAVVVPGTAAALVVVALLHRRTVPPFVVYFVLLALATSCITGVYWESLKVALMPTFFAMSVMAAYLATPEDLRKVLSIGSALLVLMLIGGWIALISAFAGLGPLTEIEGLHGRRLYAYFVTLTPTRIGNFIRPAGIYDEPGALSFVITITACLRHWMDMDRRVTWTLLIMGFVTFSLAHLIYVVVHLAAERRMLIAWSAVLLACAVAVWILVSTGLWEYFDERLLGRLDAPASANQVVRGDNRSSALIEAYEVLRDGGARVGLFGVGQACIEGTLECRREYPNIGLNPLGPMALYGAAISWPYYFFMSVVTLAGIRGRSTLPFFGAALMFAQRPFVLSMGYSMLAALVLLVALRSFRLFELARSRVGESPYGLASHRYEA